jgi:hypothetical protein
VRTHQRQQQNKIFFEGTILQNFMVCNLLFWGFLSLVRPSFKGETPAPYEDTHQALSATI